MSALAHIFAVTLPFFALVLCGYAAARSRLLPLEAVAGLNMFVLYFALPCMLYRFGNSTSIGQLFDPVICLLWLGVASLIVAWAAWLARTRGASWPDAAMGALVAAFPNSGFMGVPLILALLGQSAVGPVMSTLLIDLAMTTSICIGLSQWGMAGESGALKAAGRAFKRVLRNPMPWAILLGAISGVLEIRLWQPVLQTVNLLGDAASPVALFTIGAVLARSQMLTDHVDVRAPQLKDVGWMVASKLLLHPLMIFGLGTAAVTIGALRPETLAPLVLTAALPSASNVSLLAERFGANNGRVARIILWSTCVAFLTFTAVSSGYVGPPSTEVPLSLR